ncbi:hypothetical protein GE21DRAFT_1271401 [Neurospora crassa]|uniref:Rhodopsin domain-containing protein n=1 Tax=Neurospora crassa (strain ATCC 24698 / 74-OR23-1A / CBS 708.71 / DSM 1257 / FGSC 987) TaxID=367110 RepID=Q7S5L4_NEUCR|nr:hypothetical protein NCU05829 [Neurospora crassa OR74A]EAA30853.1 hypothetical protein NCU05829 [Neurospora crassa OR74A]KHE86584.1 hypothetical protein GE21DRAFT_1271401 [Neurospora crassa]|eukprot:XP_960089.1 hypothetical protein NCU05829 [Neurospora crassa OR74A]
MSIYTDPPALRPFSDDKPILLVSWWLTLFCTVVIILRVVGRYVRMEKLFLEDKIAALALIPMYLRVACVHVLLLYGTNNVELVNKEGLHLSEQAIARRVVGSKLVLATRFFYFTTLWTLKSITLLFFNRLVGTAGRTKYNLTLRFLQITIGCTFVACFISNLSECFPVTHYWQVTPDPGGQCRQSYAHLLVVAASSVLTDLLLVVFPIPILIQSRIKLKRKILLVSLFCLGLCTVCITLYRVPNILSEKGYQGTRTMWASTEILVATFVNNAIALGTFVRDTGPKKKKFKPQHQHELQQHGYGNFSRAETAYNAYGSSSRDRKTVSSMKPGFGSTTTATMNSFAERTMNDKRGSISYQYGVSAEAGSDNKAGIVIRTDTAGSIASSGHSNDEHVHGELSLEARDSVASSTLPPPHENKPRERDSQESLIPKPGSGGGGGGGSTEYGGGGHIGQAMSSYFGTVMKTTEISVTVTQANEEDLRAKHDGGRVPQSPHYDNQHHHYHHDQIREAPRVMTAGDRGVARGTTKLLKSLPGKEHEEGEEV